MSEETFPPEGYVMTESSIEGIAIYMPAPVQEEEEPEIVDFSCPNCLAVTAYSITAGGLTCTSCGYHEPPEHEVVGKGAQQFEFKVDVVQQAHGWGEARKELQCQNCNAATTLPTNQLTHVCPFCGSSKVLQTNARQDALRPRFLIPFKLEEDALPPIVAEWLGSSWMLPGTLQRAKVGLFNAIYLPFWTFDTLGRAGWKAEVGYTKTRRVYRDGKWETETYTDWQWEQGVAALRFDDLLVTGTKHVTQGVLNQIDDFDLEQLVIYEPKYLAGLNAQAYEIALDEAWERGRALIRQRMNTACDDDARSGGGDHVRHMSIDLDFRDEEWRYVLLPVYLAPYTFQNETYQIVVNAQTGSIGGTRPVSWPKVAGAAGALFIPAFLSAVFALIVGEFGIFIITAFLFAAAVVIAINMVNSAREILQPGFNKRQAGKAVKK